jgi:glutaminyl-peptide cyclotransferase
MFSTDSIAFSEQNAWDMLCLFASMGKRVPGTREHAESVRYFHSEMSKYLKTTWLQEFEILLRGRKVKCANICGFKEAGKRNTVLIGSHFDTRCIADNERDPELRQMPIPGVNDGTSGVAVLFELMRVLTDVAPAVNIIFVLFDAEDVGNIDGHEFGVGAAEYARSKDIKPDLAIALDMVGGEGMHLNIDYNSLLSREAVIAFNRLFSIGRSLDYPGYFDNRLTRIIGDHYPFIGNGIPALILIDIDYPQWHTHADTLDHCSSSSLKYVGEVLLRYILESPSENGDLF